MAMAALVVLHVLAALKHQFIDRDGTMRRMLPGRSI
jgi:cytochrome b561